MKQPDQDVTAAHCFEQTTFASRSVKMSAFNSPRTAQSNVVRVEDVAVARNVIRAMRSSSNSSRHYKQNATWDEHIISDINQFNRIVTEQRDVVTKTQSTEQQMNEAIAQFVPLSIVDRNKVSPLSPSVNGSTEMVTGGAFEADSSDSDEDEYSREKRTAGKKNRVLSNQESSTNSSSAAKGLAAPKADPDFDSDFDEDPSEMAELMQDFVAPSSHGASQAQSLRGSGGGAVKGRAQAYKGQSSNTSSSIRFGAAGIRGIQHQSLSRDRPLDGEQGWDAASVSTVNTGVTTATQHSIGASSAANASKLMHIKPGQAIRVKAPSKRSRSSTVSTGADQHNS